MPYGATKAEWAHFDRVLGLTEDLLPVVTDPNARIAEGSTLTKIGKTPSVLNASGHVCGIKDWTKRVATPEEIASWTRTEGYGICIQTRRVRAIDIDVPNPITAGKIAAAFTTALGVSLPIRFRSNTGKCLLAFRMEGLHSKKVMQCGTDGIVEFLANGQQFVAAGTHMEGVRYEWRDGLPNEIPTLTQQQFEDAWLAVELVFATGMTAFRPRIPQVGVDVKSACGVTDYLINTGKALGYDGRKTFVECPWKDNHTSDSGVSQSSWLRAGTSGYMRGHFVCLHAHCQDKTDDDFLEAIGYKELGIPLLPHVADNGDTEDLPIMDRHPSGLIKPTLANLCVALQTPVFTGSVVAFDTFKSSLCMAQAGTNEWVLMNDGRVQEIKRLLTATEGPKKFGEIATDTFNNALKWIEEFNQIDTAQIWLNKLRWDGVERVRDFCIKYFVGKSVETWEREYLRDISLYMWTAMAGRILSPGVQADMVIIASGKQGIGKSRGFAALAPSPEFYCDLDISKNDADLARLMRGKLIIELGELKGMRKKERESTKSLVTRSIDSWVPKFREFDTAYKRRSLFFGTTNHTRILEDPTGLRRWLPFAVDAVDKELIARDALQLWAEGADIFKHQGVCWQIDEARADKMRKRFARPDPLVEIIAEWLCASSFGEPTPASKGVVRITEIAKEVLNAKNEALNSAMYERIENVLLLLGAKEIIAPDGKSSWDVKMFDIV